MKRRSVSSELKISKGNLAGLRGTPENSVMNAMRGDMRTRFVAPAAKTEMLQIFACLEDVSDEIEDTVALSTPDPALRMALHLLRGHLDAKVVTASSLISAGRVPYATANRRLKDMIRSGLIKQRPRTRTGKSFSMHPSETLIEHVSQLSGRLLRLGSSRVGGAETRSETTDYYFGGSCMTARSIPPLAVLSEPLKLAGGVRVLVHGDPTLMVMDNPKRQIEQTAGTQIHQRAFSIDRLREEAIPMRRARRAGTTSSPSICHGWADLPNRAS